MAPSRRMPPAQGRSRGRGRGRRRRGITRGSVRSRGKHLSDSNDATPTFLMETDVKQEEESMIGLDGDSSQHISLTFDPSEDENDKLSSCEQKNDESLSTLDQVEVSHNMGTSEQIEEDKYNYSTQNGSPTYDLVEHTDGTQNLSPTYDPEDDKNSISTIEQKETEQHNLSTIDQIKDCHNMSPSKLNDNDMNNLRTLDQSQHHQSDHHNISTSELNLNAANQYENNEHNLHIERQNEENKQDFNTFAPIGNNKENIIPNVGENKDLLVYKENCMDTCMLEQKEESMDDDDLIEVVRTEVPSLDGDLLQHLQGILKKRCPLRDMVRTIARLARRKQQPITRYFPVVNRSTSETKEPAKTEELNNNITKDMSKNETKGAKIETEGPKNETDGSKSETEESNTNTNKDMDHNYASPRNDQKEVERPSWDVAGPSHKDIVLSDLDDDDMDVNLDGYSLSSTSTRVPTPVEDNEDLDQLFPSVNLSQKASPILGRRVKEETKRSPLWGRVAKRGKGKARGRGRGRKAESEDPDENNDALEMFLSKMHDLSSAAVEPLPSDFEMPKTSGKVNVPNAGEEDDEELGVAETYADYVPAKLKYGCRHPDPVVETSSLSSVDIADITYQLSLPQPTIDEGKLSALQLEAVVYASQAHEHILPDGMRAGFLIGDGAGVGKGRTIAGIIFENYLKGRKRAVWVSVSNDLKYDAERDLRDIGAGFIQVHQLNKMPYSPIQFQEGVVFSTYSSLIGHTAAAGCKYKRRLDQLVAWCGTHFDGCIVFDECHRAKNLCPSSATNPTETGKAVLQLQVSLPSARLVYASATGASEPRNMAYMVRLGIWGAGSPFLTFRDFLTAVEKRGVGAMEIVAMDMKLRGMYIARQLSFHGVTFKIEEVPLSAQFRDTYDKAVALWVEAKKAFDSAAEMVKPSARWRRVMCAQFWGAHQRFFKYLCIAAKVERTVQCTKEAVAGGKCVVVGLQSTGEARTVDELGKAKGQLTEFICTAKGVFVSLVEKQFPCPNNMLEDDDYIDKSPPSPLVGKEANKMCDKLLRDIAQLGRTLPPNTLDQLIDQLGGAKYVAEMTGRKGRVVQNSQGQILYESRSEADVPLETLNLTEKQRFMDGEKDIAIISEAASSGISLQSDRRVLNQKRRVHITLELPWSADRAIQQFGRTHRSNQVNAPEYIFLISDLAGERRFASTVAKRLESLGALTHGDRRATRTRDLSQFNIENKHGRQALRSMLNAIFGAAPPLVPPPTDYPGDFIKDAAAALTDVGIELHDDGASMIPRFLNRLLGVRVTLQNTLFQYFSDTFVATVKEAKRNGRFDLGILDVGASGQVVRRSARSRYMRTHATGHAPVELHTLHVERGLEWEKAVRKYEEERMDPAEGFYLARTAFNNTRNAILCLAHSATRDLPGTNRLFNVYRPNLGMQPQPELLSDILNKYAKSNPRDAELPWRRYYEQSLTVCSHAWWHGHCKNIGCEVGTRRRVYYVLSGSVLAAWRTLEHTYKQLHVDNRMQVVRIRTHTGLKIIGTLIPKYVVDLLMHHLKTGAVSVEEEQYTM